MYLFLGIFPYSRPVDQSNSPSRDAFFDPKDKRKEEKTLSSPFFFSLSLAAETRTRERCILPLCGGGGGGGGGLCNNAFSREERRRVIKLFQSKKERCIFRKVKVKVPLPSPTSCELTTTTTNTNTNTSKKKQKEGRGFVCKNTKTHNSLVGKRNNKEEGKKGRDKKKRKFNLLSREKKNCLFCVLFLSKRLIRKETLVATTTDKTPRKEKKPRAPTPPGRGFVLSRFLFAASREVKPPACSWWWCF